MYNQDTYAPMGGQQSYGSLYAPAPGSSPAYAGKDAGKDARRRKQVPAPRWNGNPYDYNNPNYSPFEWKPSPPPPGPRPRGTIRPRGANGQPPARGPNPKVPSPSGGYTQPVPPPPPQPTGPDLGARYGSRGGGWTSVNQNPMFGYRGPGQQPGGWQPPLPPGRQPQPQRGLDPAQSIFFGGF